MATKGNINLQLNINTQFTNVKSAVDAFQKQLSNIKIDTNFSNSKGLADNFSKQADQIRIKLQEINDFDFNTDSSKNYAALLQDVRTQYAQLSAAVNDYKVSLGKEKSEVQDKLKTEQENLQALKEKSKTEKEYIDGFRDYHKVLAEAKAQNRELTDDEKLLVATYSSETKTMKQLKEEHKNTNQAKRDSQAEIKKLQAADKSYTALLKTEKEVQSQVKTAIDTTTKAREDEYTAARNQEAINKANAAQSQQQVKNNQKIAESAKKAADEAARIQQEWNITSETFSSNFEAAATSSNKLTSALESQITKWTSLGFIVHTTINAIRDIVQTYQELDDNLSAISAVSGIATESLWGNMPQMIDNANSLALSVDDLTNGMLLFYQQGLSTEETEIRLNAAGKMAAISQQDLATAVDQLTSTMNAFGMEGDDAASVVDVFANMAGRTATDVEELATAMARTASIAKNAGMSFEQTTAFIATMEETTRLSAETIGNSMKSIIARFQKLKTDPDSLLEDGVNANDVEKALKKADVALRDTEGNFRNIGDVIMELSAKWDTLDTNTQKYIATMAAGTQQSSNFIALVSNNQSNIDNLAYAMDAAGAAEEQFAAVSTNISSALTRLDNNWIKLKTSFNDGRNIIVDVINDLSSLVGFVADLGPAFTTATAAIGLAAIKMALFTTKSARQVSIQELKNTITKSGMDLDKQDKLMTDLVSAAKEKQTKRVIELRIATEKLSDAEKKQIADAYEQATANNASLLTWKNLKASIGDAANQLFAFVSTPIGAISALVAVITAITWAMDKFGISVKGAKEQLENTRSEWQSTQSELESTQTQLDSIAQKIDEINSKDVITLSDAQELSNLTLENIKLQEQVDLLKQKADLQRDQTIKEEKDSFDAYKNKENIKNAFLGTKDSLDSKIAEYSGIKDKDWSGQFDEKLNEWYRNKLKEELVAREELAIQTIKDLDDKMTAEGKDSLTQREQELYAEAKEWRDKIQKELSPETYVRNAIADTVFADPETLVAVQNAGKEIMDNLANGMISDSEAQIQIGDLLGEYLTNPELLNKIGATEDDVQTMSDALIELALNEGNARDNLVRLNSSVQQYGNIANNSRQIITWNSEAIQKWGDALASWQMNADEFEGSISTALGSFDYINENGFSDASNGIAIAFTPILNTDDGPKVLSNSEMNNYLQQIYANANGDANKLLEEDAKGVKMVVNNQLVEVKNMLAGAEGAIVDGVKETAEDCAGMSGMAAEDIKAQFGETGRYAEDSMHQVQEAFIRAQEALSETNPFLAMALQLIMQMSGLDFSSLDDGLNDAADAADNATNAVSSLKTQMSEVSNAASDLKNAASDLSGVADAYKTLTTAIKDYNADGNITLSNLESLLSLSPEYLSCLEMENGQLSLNTEGLKGIVLMRIQAAKAAAYQSAMEQIQAITMSSSATAASTAGEAIAGMEAATSNAATAMSTASNTAATSTGTMANLAQSGYTVAAGFDTAASSAANFNNVLANKLTEAGTGIKYTAEDVASMIAGDISGITDVLGDAVGDVVTGLQSQLSMLDNLENQVNSMDFGSFIGKYGGSSKGGSGGSGTKGATEASNELKNALEAQKKALQEQQKELEKSKSAIEEQKKALEDQKKALEETNKQLQENYKLYVELIKSRLNDEIDRQTTRIEAFYDAIKDTIQSEIDSFNDQLDALKKQADELKSKADELQDAADQQEDSLNKLYDAAQAYYDAAQDGLDNQIDSYDKVIDRNKEHIDLLNEQKDAIQDQIDALDTAADSESKLLALEKARDALANARNQKTRMVLTNGGWRLRTDKSEISNAQSNLVSAQRDYQKEILERQQKKIEEQTDEIEKQNNNLENIKSDLEDQKDALDDIKDQWDKAQDALGKTTSELEEQTNLIRQFQYGNDASRQDQLSNFSGQVSNNNQQQQAASDATNRANEASNKYDQQSNEDVQGSIAEAIKKLEEQQNQADEALKQYFENQLSNNAETAQIQQEMKDLINQMVNGQIGQLENFAQFYETINGALEQANTNASQTADYINNINAAIDRYDEWSNRLDMTTDEINQRQAIMNEINNATLGSLLEGGSTFGQLQGQYEQIVRNNDEAERIQDQIDGLDEQANVIQTQINALKEQENKISEQEKELSNANSNKTANAAKAAGNTAASGAKAAGSGIRTNADKNTARIIDAINSKDISVTIQETSKGSGGGSGKYLMARYNTGGMLGFSHGGVDDVTTVAAVHGSKNRPELVLNNSQSAALFKYIDSMTRIPTLSSAGSARNALMGFGTTNNTNNNGTNFTNCEFNVESNADNLDSLVQDLKQSASIRR